MNNSLNKYNWSEYLEIPIKQSSPVKIDKILKQRMRVFLKARQARLRTER